MNLILIGFRCAGKTTVGRLLAERLKLDFVDVDDLIEERTGKSIAELWEERGEFGFRAIESSVIEALSRNDNLVIALGGGAVSRYRNVYFLKRKGTFILLEADTRSICSRMAADATTKSRRPPLRDRERPISLAVEEESAARRSYYLNIADYVVSTTDKLQEMVVDEVMGLLSAKGFRFGREEFPIR